LLDIGEITDIKAKGYENHILARWPSDRPVPENSKISLYENSFYNFCFIDKHD
jgi:hypothetical protein